MSNTTIPATAFDAVLNGLEVANRRVAARFPGELPARQPVHVVYGGAHLFTPETIPKLGAIARRALDQYAPSAETLAEAIGFDLALARRIYPRLADKLTREPVEDFRIDFEDGFGNRPDEEEDRFAVDAARHVAAAARAGALPDGIGIRIKPLGEELKRRSLRTFDLFLTALLDASAGVLPANFVVTLPKVTTPAQVAALAAACDALEAAGGLAPGSVGLELNRSSPTTEPSPCRA
jgi:hypothetical protein